MTDIQCSAIPSPSLGPWATKQAPVMGAACHAKRRNALLDQFDGDLLMVLAQGGEQLRNGDAHFAFRGHSNFLYLTGFEEPEAYLVLRRQGDEVRHVLFCRPKDPEREIWDGFRFGPEGVQAQFGLQEAFELDQLDEQLALMLKDVTTVAYDFSDQSLHQKLHQAMNGLQRQVRAGACKPFVMQDASSFIHEQRLIKDDQEQALMSEVAELTAVSHARAMQACKPGMMEYQLQAEYEYGFRIQGALHQAYTSIVAGGANACVLHYIANNQALKGGDLVLVDAGAELHHYAADITRTFPVSGVFSEPQKQLYECVLAAQEAAIDAVRVGATFDDYHQAALKVLTQGLIDLGILEGELEACLEAKAYQPFYMHKTGHWLGLDVHDTGRYKQAGDWRSLQAGMVLTVEPGLYIAQDCEQAPEQFRGIGIRIEDDVLVTSQGPKVLTASVPKTVADIERLMAAPSL